MPSFHLQYLGQQLFPPGGFILMRLSMPSPVRRRRLLVAAVLIAAAGITAQSALGRKKDKPDAASPLDDQKRAVHALNRLTFGPRPGDVERVRQMGVDKWIDLQLHPEKINDSALDARLAAFRTLRMDTNQIIENFPPEQIIRQVADGKAAAASRSHAARRLRSAASAARR